MKIVRRGLNEYFMEQVGDLYKENPEIQIQLVLKNTEGKVVGGLLGETVFKAMYINQLWIQEQYRRQGYGRELVITAERIAKEKGCISGLAMVYSFQTPEFFQKLGYETFGFSDGYPTPTKEYYFKKIY
jgi:ribosomal protein S18 acetylase RimI-like enzyme